MANKPSLTDIFSAMTANETIEAAKVQKNPKKLWHEFWIENEVCCLFADTNVGKRGRRMSKGRGRCFRQDSSPAKDSAASPLRFCR